MEVNFVAEGSSEGAIYTAADAVHFDKVGRGKQGAAARMKMSPLTARLRRRMRALEACLGVEG